MRDPSGRIFVLQDSVSWGLQNIYLTQIKSTRSPPGLRNIQLEISEKLRQGYLACGQAFTACFLILRCYIIKENPRTSSQRFGLFPSVLVARKVIARDCIGVRVHQKVREYVLFHKDNEGGLNAEYRKLGYILRHLKDLERRSH